MGILILTNDRSDKLEIDCFKGIVDDDDDPVTEDCWRFMRTGGSLKIPEDTDAADCLLVIIVAEDDGGA